MNPNRFTSIVNTSFDRRDLLKGGAAALTLAVISGPLLTACADQGSKGKAASLAPGHFLRIGSDNVVTIISPNTELGQGAYTGLATLVAEELDADWSQIVVEAAPADVKRYGNPAFGGALQGTGGSTTIAAFWDPMRQAGATARAMLVAAAAQDWNVPAGEIVVSKGVVPTRKGLRIFHAVLRDDTGLLECAWPGQSFLDRTIEVGQTSGHCV